MSLSLQRFAAGDTNYIAKLDSNCDAIEAAVDALATALGTTSTSYGPFLQGLLGSAQCFLGSSSYQTGTSGTILNVSGGYVWRPDLGSVLSKASTTGLDFTGQSAATYYVVIGADGTPTRSATSTNALWSVVWTGSAFGTITALCPYALGGDLADSTSLTSVSIVAGAVSLAKMANLAAHSIIGNNTGSPATPIALTASQVKALLAIADSDITYASESANIVHAGPSSGGAATPTWRALVVADLGFAGSANGVATLDSGGKVPTAQLPSAVTGALHYLGTWNANTNSPALASGVGSTGGYYKVSVAGTTSIDSIASWNIGDSIVFDGTTWDKIDGIANEVVTVAGLVGAITASALKTALAISSSDVSGLAAVATSGSATDLTTGSLALARIHTIADASILGNNSGGVHIPIELTAAQVKTLLAIASGDVSGLAASATTDTTNASNISSGTLNRARLSTLRFDIGVCFAGVPTASQTITYCAARAITIDHTAPGSAKAGTASTGSVSVTINKNGASQGTVAFAASATGAFSIGSDITLAAGDLLTFVAPGSPDATLADIGITLAGLA
jgi:hypothetical protein